jgi:hypothetical protein
VTALEAQRGPRFRQHHQSCGKAGAATALFWPLERGAHNPRVSRPRRRVTKPSPEGAGRKAAHCPCLS